MLYFSFLVQISLTLIFSKFYIQALFQTQITFYHNQPLAECFWRSTSLTLNISVQYFVLFQYILIIKISFEIFNEFQTIISYRVVNQYWCFGN